MLTEFGILLGAFFYSNRVGRFYSKRSEVSRWVELHNNSITDEMFEELGVC